MIKNKITFLKLNKFFIQNKISIHEVKKFFKKKGFDINKKRKITVKIENLGALSRTFISSLIIISVFFISPIFINFIEEKTLLSSEVENNSKSNFKKVLENQEPKLDAKLDKQYLYDDILEFDEQPNDSVKTL